MNNIAIEVTKVSKKYTIGKQNIYLTLRDRLVQHIREVLKPEKQVNFWALKNISFNVERGEVLGLVGKNGAGKSTLLKMLARITYPTSGAIKMQGRIASMLEVGTGFNPELTGRENIYLNGAILGMSRREINRKFHEIVKFSGIEEFLDTPVKHYSSGMYVRLAFSVAAHLESDIVLIDEVLAVGDVEFQKKCLGKISEMSNSGKTIIFVSHNPSTIRDLCTRTILLENGKLISAGTPEKILNLYLNQKSRNKHTLLHKERLNHKKPFQILSVNINKLGKNNNLSFENSEELVINFELKISQPYPGLYGYCTVLNQEEQVALESDSFDTPGNPLGNLSLGTHQCQMTIPARSLAPGKYHLYYNFSYTGGNIYNYAYPGVVGYFELHDTKTQRGDNRHGFVGSIMHWEKK